MPCYQVQTVSVEFKAQQKGLLERAAKSLGYLLRESGSEIIMEARGLDSISVDLAKQKATSRSQSAINSLKRQYSKEALKMVAKLGGWQMTAKNESDGLLIRGVL